MKTVHTYVCTVDTWRRPSRQRNTQGRYLAGAKSEKEAKALVQAAIGFGSVKVYYRATGDDGEIPADNRHDRKMALGQVMRVLGNGSLEPPRKATDPLDG